MVLNHAQFIIRATYNYLHIYNYIEYHNAQKKEIEKERKKTAMNTQAHHNINTHSLK